MRFGILEEAGDVCQERNLGSFTVNTLEIGPEISREDRSHDWMQKQTEGRFGGGTISN